MGRSDEVPDKFCRIFLVVEVDGEEHNLEADGVVVDIKTDELHGVRAVVNCLRRDRLYGVESLQLCLEGRREFCGGRGPLVPVAIFRDGDAHVGRMQSCCPKVSKAVHRPKPRKGSARDRARVSGGLGVGG